MNDNLPELRDIHLPNGVSIFPPAYGWWMILALIIALIIINGIFGSLRKKSKKRYALNLLSQINANNIVPAAVEISEILRRICVYKYPSANALFGKDWLTFLNNNSTQKLSGKPADLLINAPYIKTESTLYGEHDVKNLISYAQNWIGENL
ncbi:MAG: DUF4381 domain-containing protein [Lactobacillaceae bacterium]|nr:DUF4381 domain-containing protein [Lactobacillaceae bacterium]